MCIFARPAQREVIVILSYALDSHSAISSREKVYVGVTSLDTNSSCVIAEMNLRFLI